MTGGVDSEDCDWILNLINSDDIQDASKNFTLCEEYFAKSATTILADEIIIETESNILETMTEPAATESMLSNLLLNASTAPSTSITPEEATQKVSSFIETSTQLLEKFIVSTTTTATLSNNSTSWSDLGTSNETSDIDMDEIIKAANKPYNMSLNASLCAWYLPTIHQVPRALGDTGIALWVLGFLITLTLILMFVRQFHFIYTTAHKSFRRHLFSINSIYVVMALMTSIGSGIPRAHAVCSAIKDVYMAIGIGHFVDLTISMYGGENVMAWHLKDRLINVRVVVFLKCFFCIPRCETKKLSVNILKWLVWQMKWSQAIYYLIKLVWRKSLENVLGIVPPSVTSAFLYMHIINVMSFISGVASLLIISSLVTEDLQEKYNYTIKAKTVRFTILTTKLQRLLFEILEAFDVFPCIPPLVSKKFFKNVLKDFIYLVEVLILGTITFFVYTKQGEYEEGNSKDLPQRLVLQDEELMLEENGGFEDPKIALTPEGPESRC